MLYSGICREIKNPENTFYFVSLCTKPLCKRIVINLQYRNSKLSLKKNEIGFMQQDGLEEKNLFELSFLCH